VERDPSSTNETVLLVEDREEVRRALREYLRHLGYDVLDATKAEEALALASRGAQIDVLLTDVNMPGGSGTDLADAIRAVLPGIRVVFMSGYAPDPAMRERMGLLGATFLQKPFATSELVALLPSRR
jgi:CheY-like chemotaxis protein